MLDKLNGYTHTANLNLNKPLDLDKFDFSEMLMLIDPASALPSYLLINHLSVKS